MKRTLFVGLASQLLGLLSLWGANEDAVALQKFFDAEWDYQMEQNPVRASSMGDRRWNDRWDDRRFWGD